MSFLQTIRQGQGTPNPVPLPNGNAQTWQMGGGFGPNTAGAQGGASSPFQPTYLQDPPTLDPTFFQGAGNDPSLVLQNILQGFAPSDANAQRSLMDVLSAAGIQGGAGVPAEQELQAQLAAAKAPSIAGAYEQMYGRQQQAGLANTGYANQANMQNLQDIMGTNQFNVGTANTAQSNMLNALMQQWQQQYGAFNNLNQQGLGGAQNIAAQGAQNYGQQAPPGGGFAALGQQLGGLFAPRNTQPVQQQIQPQNFAI